jgi:hypothetical protein
VERTAQADKRIKRARLIFQFRVQVDDLFDFVEMAKAIKQLCENLARVLLCECL